MNEWSTEFPTEPGWYWFYGYRFGKVVCGRKVEPELCSVKALLAGSGGSEHIMHHADGHFMYESEVECPHFMQMHMPLELPELEENTE
jgi:hypothetical protein